MNNKLHQLSGSQLRHLRRDWQTKGGGEAVDRGTLEPYHEYIETVDTFTDGTPIVLAADGMIVTEPMEPVAAELAAVRAEIKTVQSKGWWMSYEMSPLRERETRLRMQLEAK